jgi:hypothetical protein
MIAGVRASAPSMSREKRARMRAMALVCGLVEEINGIKVGEGNKIVKEHI